VFRPWVKHQAWGCRQGSAQPIVTKIFRGILQSLQASAWELDLPRTGLRLLPSISFPIHCSTLSYYQALIVLK
jgi:hypothetical protein